MSRCLFLFLIFFFVVNSNAHATDALWNDLVVTESFFQKLTDDYGSILPSEDVTKELDDRIANFVRTLQSPIRWRNKRHLDESSPRADSGVRVLRGFSRILAGASFQNVLEITVFTHYDGSQLQWFAATLDASKISLYLYNGNQLDEISLYPSTNGSSLIADCSELGCVLVTSKIDGSVTILRLEAEASGYFLSPVQYLEGFGDVHLSIWHEMNEVFLGIASSSNISIYHWLGEHFDSIQVLDYGAGKLTPFKIGGSLYLALTGARVRVLRFVLQQNEFVSAQRLPSAYDAESFYVKRGHQMEHYLVLANQECTVIYKFVDNRFMPFQNIPKADKISSITSKETVLILTITDRLLKIYQYDGWRFIQLGVTMPEVDSVYPTSLDGEIILIVKYTNGMWRFNRLIWKEQSTWKVMSDEIKSWCVDTIEKAKRQPAEVPKFNGTLRILNGQIGKLETKSINAKDTKELMNLSDRFERLRLNLTASTKTFSQLMTRNNPTFNILHASKVEGKCTFGCKINNLSTLVKYPLLEKLARPSSLNQGFEFESVSTQSIGNFRCPKPAVVLKNVTVDGTVNGIPFEYLQENLLRVTGDQEITGVHIYQNLSASSATIPTEIATRSTQQALHIHSLRANNLHLSQGGILLPLDGQPVAINEPMITTKVKVTGPVHLNGMISGVGIKNLTPMTWIEKPLLLRGNYFLQKVTVRNETYASDLTLDRTRSLTQIINEAVRLDENVPVHLKLSKAKTIWTNITANITTDWITVSSDNSNLAIVRNITGPKRCLNDLTLPNSSYENLPVPKFQKPLCVSEATIDNIETMLVTIGQASAERLTAEYIFGAPDLNDLITDTATLTQHLNLSSKTFTGVFHVKNASINAIDGIDFPRLLDAMVGWRNPGLVKGLVNASNLSIERLLASNGFAQPLVTSARNLISKGNIYFDNLNKINILSLLEDAVKLDENVSLLANVTFAGGLNVTSIQTDWAPVDLSGSMDMGIKTIAGNLKSANLTVPYSFTYSSTNTPTNLIIKGSATFPSEPKVENLNKRNLNELYERIWFTDRPSTLFNRVFTVRHMVLEGPVQILGSLNSQSYGPWIDLPERLLSRTKDQEINQHVYLRAATAPNVVTEKALNLSAPETFLGGLGDHSLRKYGSQSLMTDMHFQELIISGDLITRSKINNKDLSTDIVRFDVKENIITGRKTVLTIYAENINVDGWNFGEWQKNTLSTLNTGHPIYIEGSKTFQNLTMLEPLRLDGLLKGRRVDNYLLKSAPQDISGMKKIDGTISASEIFIDGLVNDMNLESLVTHQLKKNKRVQTIHTKILTKGNVHIIGDLVVNSLYHGVELKDLNTVNSGLESVSKRMAELKTVAEQIQTALSRKAWYWNKLELIHGNATTLIADPDQTNPVAFEGLGNCTSKDSVLTCDDQTIQLLTDTRNSSRTLFHQVFQMAGIPLIVVATADPNGGVWICTYDNMGKKFYQIAGFNLPGATHALAIETGGSLWLAVQLMWDTIILHYDVLGQFAEYTLPGTDLFSMEIAPTGELLIFRSDGVWRLGGLAGPRQLFRAHLNGKISTYKVKNDQYVQLIRKNNVSLLKARYIGNLTSYQ